MKGIVIESYQAAFPEPFAIAKGERLILGKRDAEWPGWVWCTNQAGESRWVPEGYIDVSGTQGVALRDYESTELTVEEGEEVQLHYFESGWYWVTDRRGQSGWVPARHVQALAPDLRQAGLEDAACIVELIQQLAGSLGETSPLSQDYVLKYLAVPGNHILLAESQKKAIGLISYSIRPNLYHAGDSCLIEELVVHESQRGLGVGGALMEHLLAQLEALGVEEVSVSVMPENLDALKFYRRYGLTDEAIFLEKHL